MLVKDSEPISMSCVHTYLEWDTHLQKLEEDMLIIIVFTSKQDKMVAAHNEAAGIPHFIHSSPVLMPFRISFSS